MTVPVRRKDMGVSICQKWPIEPGRRTEWILTILKTDNSSKVVRGRGEKGGVCAFFQDHTKL